MVGLVDPAHALHHDIGHFERDRNHGAVGHLVFDEPEVSFVPRKQVVDALLGFQAQDLLQVILGDRVQRDQNLAEKDMRRLLQFHGVLERRLVDIAALD